MVSVCTVHSSQYSSPLYHCWHNLTSERPEIDRNYRFFSYFTELSSIGLCAYYWASGVQTASYARNGKTSYALQRWPRFLQLLHVFLQSTIVVMREFPTTPHLLCVLLTIDPTAIIVTAVFWALLSSPKIWSNKFSGASPFRAP